MHATTTCLVVGETTGGPCMHAACIARRPHAHVSLRRAFLNAYMCEESFLQPQAQASDLGLQARPDDELLLGFSAAPASFTYLPTMMHGIILPPPALPCPTRGPMVTSTTPSSRASLSMQYVQAPFAVV
jgi:hypothetical protein